MTREEIVSIAQWKEGCATFSVDIPLFAKAVEFSVATAVNGQLSDRTVQTISQVLALGVIDLDRLREVVWENCLLNFDISSYGFDVREGQTETESNFEGFGVTDADSAYAKTRLCHCWIDEENQSKFTANYATFFMVSPWETHGLDIVVREGRVVGGGENGVWIGRFEPKCLP